MRRVEKFLQAISQSKFTSNDVLAEILHSSIKSNLGTIFQLWTPVYCYDLIKKLSWHFDISSGLHWTIYEVGTIISTLQMKKLRHRQVHLASVTKLVHGRA